MTDLTLVRSAARALNVAPRDVAKHAGIPTGTIRAALAGKCGQLSEFQREKLTNIAALRDELDQQENVARINARK